MRELFSNKTFITQKLLPFSKFILIITLFIFFIPLLILPFYNHPFADDYFCGYNLNNKGFIPYQEFIYRNWGGRFAATFTGSLFAYHNFLYNHYYIHSLLLLVMDFTSIFFLVDTINKYILGNEFNLSKKLISASLLLALQMCSLAQVSTFIFWFSSSITYLFPSILIQIEIALLILFYYTNNRLMKVSCTVILPVLVFITTGFNELFLVVQLFLFSFILCFKRNKKISLIFILCVIAFIASSKLLLFAPGNKIRMHEIDSKSLLTGVAAISYHITEIIWNIFKTPIFWFVSIAVCVYANFKKENWQHNLLIQRVIINRWRFAFLIILFLIASVALPVVALKGGIIPDRYANAVICFMLILMLLYFFIIGISTKTKTLATLSETNKAVLYFLIAIGLLCNNYIIESYKSIIIAPVYNIILNQREAALKNAATGNKKATVKSYYAALSDLIQTKYSSSSVTYQQLIQQKPPLLFFEDDLATISSIDVLKKYYGLDSITVVSDQY